MEKVKTTSLYVHCCHKCGKPVTPEPTSLEVIDEVVILCSDCGKGVPISQGRKVKIIEQSAHDKISNFEQRINNFLEDGWTLVAATNDPHSKIVYLIKEEKHD